MTLIDIKLTTLEGEPLCARSLPLRAPIIIGTLTDEAVAHLHATAPYTQEHPLPTSSPFKNRHAIQYMGDELKFTPIALAGYQNEAAKVLAHKELWQELLAIDQTLFGKQPNICIQIDEEFRENAAAFEPREAHYHRDNAHIDYMYIIGSDTKELNTVFKIGGKTYSVPRNTIILLPKDILHRSSEDFPKHPGIPWFFGRAWVLRHLKS